MERVLERSNLKLAYQRVVENKGAPGVDDLTTLEFKDSLKVRWSSVQQALLEGGYLPRPVRRVDIAKPVGGIRTLGVPTVIDRLIQQALHQALQPLFERRFSDASFGFRPGRGAHQAQKSAVARPWGGKCLGFNVTSHRESRLRIAPESVRSLSDRVRELLRRGRGRSLAGTIETLNPVLRGWINYCRLTDTRGILEQLDSWVRRRLRCLLWRQWKRPKTRERKMLALALDADRAWASSLNGRGAWWNAGASPLMPGITGGLLHDPGAGLADG